MKEKQQLVELFEYWSQGTVHSALQLSQAENRPTTAAAHHEIDQSQRYYYQRLYYSVLIVITTLVYTEQYL